jgi:flagellar motor component MotA
MDLTTITGLIIEVIVLANAAGGSLGNILYGFPLIIVILGGIAATLVAYPIRSMPRSRNQSRPPYQKKS